MSSRNRPSGLWDWRYGVALPEEATCPSPAHKESLRVGLWCPTCAQVSSSACLILLPGDCITTAHARSSSFVVAVGAQLFVGKPHLYVLDPEEHAPRPASAADIGIVGELTSTEGVLHRRLDWLRAIRTAFREGRHLVCYADLARWTEVHSLPVGYSKMPVG